MNIEKITNVAKEIGTKMKEKVSSIKPEAKVTDKIIQGGKEKIKHSMDAMSNIGKAGINKLSTQHQIKELATKEAYRFNSLVSESRSLGVEKEVAKKGAETLICATGKFAHKNAEKSAEVFIANGKTWLERANDLATKKNDLLNKFLK